MNEQNKTMHGYINIPSKKKASWHIFLKIIYMKIYFKLYIAYGGKTKCNDKHTK